MMKSTPPNLLLLFLFLMTSLLIHSVYATIDVGSSREEVIVALGEPSGTMKSGDSEILSYGTAIVEIVNGKVVYCDENLEEKITRWGKDLAFDAEQKAQGLVSYDGQWVSPAEKERLVAKKEKTQQGKRREPPVKIYANGGRLINMQNVLVRGKITIVDFYADWCGPCKQIAPLLEKLAQSDPAVCLRKIDIVNWKTPVVRQYNIRSVPNIRVFNRRGTMVGQPTHSYQQVLAYIKQAQ